MRIFTTIAGSALAIITAVGGAVVLSSGTGPNCGVTTVDVEAIKGHLTVAGFTGDQLVNAGLIMNAASAAGLPTSAQTLGVMTAMGESSLRNLTYGDDLQGVTNPDGTATTSLGLFQQQDWWGSRADRLDPSTSAALFFARLTTVPAWETLPPSQAAHQVQANADPDHYTPFYAPAAEIVTTLATIGATSCISSDPQALAQELVTHANDGTLRGLVPDHIKEIRWISQGLTIPDCGIDTRMLQVMVIAVRNFETVGVSDINRRCTDQKTEGAGTTSSHYSDGGGHAVDFFSLNGTALDGADPESIKLIGLLDPVMPAGSRVGQSDCRAEIGIVLQLSNMTDFPDKCTHLHVDVAYADDRPVAFARH